MTGLAKTIPYSCFRDFTPCARSKSIAFMKSAMTRVCKTLNSSFQLQAFRSEDQNHFFHARGPQLVKV